MYQKRVTSTPRSVPATRSSMLSLPPSMIRLLGPAVGVLPVFSAQKREEEEVIGIGGQDLPQRATINANEVTRYDLRHQYSGDNWLNDAHITYEDLSWAPHPATAGNGYILNVSVPTANDRQIVATILSGGAGPNNQNKGQDGWAIQDDLDSGRLIELCPQWHPPFLMLSVAYPPSRYRPVRISAFVDYLRTELPKAGAGIIATGSEVDIPASLQNMPDGM